MLDNQDLTNILALIKIAPITGEQAITVAILQQKITALLAPNIKTNKDSEPEVEKSINSKKK